MSARERARVCVCVFLYLDICDKVQNFGSSPSQEEPSRYSLALEHAHTATHTQSREEERERERRGKLTKDRVNNNENIEQMIDAQTKKNKAVNETNDSKHIRINKKYALMLLIDLWCT